jgi:hypothetical protein
VDAEDILVGILPLVTLMGLFALAALWIWGRNRLREAEHRERLAMIERGLAPPSEVDALVQLHAGRRPTTAAAVRAYRMRSAGILFIGFGLALWLLLSFTVDDSRIAIGIGGAIAIMGAAFVVMSHSVPPDSRNEETTGGNSPAA